MHASICLQTQSFRIAAIGTLLCLATAPLSVVAGDPLHQRIDKVFYESAIGPFADKADDFTFIRRVYLDLIGRIPSSAETRAFVSDASETRRVDLVDRLLAGDEFPQHMATVFDVMLMERRGGKHVKAEAFRAWLQSGFEKNKPFHQLAGELIMAGDGNNSAAFFLERDVEPNLMTREVSRMFFGRDIQCAQCHDHPNVDDYKQGEYYGIFAFLNRSSLFQPDKKKPAVLAESADGQSTFKSVFTDRAAFTSPRMPGEPEIAEPAFAAGQEYKVRGTKTVAAVPAYSRRARLAELVSSGQNEYFRRNIANRLWALVMGKGLVHPVDWHHSSNPPSNPELMKLMATEIAAMNFDVKLFLRELVLTDVYQRQHSIDDSVPTKSQQISAAIAELEKTHAAATAVSQAKSAEADKALEQLDAAITSAEPIRAAWVKVRGAATAAAKKHFDALTAENGKKSALANKTARAKTIREILGNVQRATALIGESKELAATTGTLNGRSDKLMAEAKKLQAEVDAAAKATAAAAAVLAKANAAESAERAKFEPLQQAMRKHRTALVASLKESQDAWASVTNAAVKKTFLTSIVSKNEAAQKLPAAKASESAVKKLQSEAVVRATTTEKQMTLVNADMATAESNREGMQKRMSDISAVVAEKQQAAAQLADAVARLNSAAQMLNDKTLKAAAAEVKKSEQRASQAMSRMQAEKDEVVQQLSELTQQISDLRASAAEMQKQRDAAKAQVDATQKKLVELRQQLVALQTTVDDSSKIIDEGVTRAFHQSTIESLTPEQLAWSILQASGQAERQFVADLAKLNKAKPLTDEQKKDAAFVAQREKEARAAARVTLEKQVAVFVNLFGAESGQPQDAFFATVDQALFFANGSQIRGWLSPSGDNLTGRLLKLEAADELAEELYLSIFVRKPTAEEISDVRNYVSVRGDQKKEAVQELAWALLTSAEFRFQY